MEPVVAITSRREPRMDCYISDLHGVDQTQVAIFGGRGLTSRSDLPASPKRLARLAGEKFGGATA
jgi:hypothetical protein